jgi:transcriptional regulator with XRE-family HTH domain
MKTGIAVGHLAKSKGITQVAVAKACGVSRISIHRFFKGQTELKATDFMNVLMLLGIDIKAQLSVAVSSEFSEWLQKEEEIKAAIIKTREDAKANHLGGLADLGPQV